MSSVKKQDLKMSLDKFIYKHSPLKSGKIKIKDENKPLNNYNNIMNRIYLGNIEAAKDKKFFKEKNIKAVLNCTKERDIPNYFSNKKDIEYIRIPVDDSLLEKDFELMYKYMPCIVEFIHKHADISKNNILIHCWAGRQRSAIAVAAYLIDKHEMTPHEACKLILEKRPEAFFFGESLNFKKSLEKYYKDVLHKRQ